jgi:hypothetical protein
MIRSSALRGSAGFLLAAILLLPAVAAAGEGPRSPAGPASFLGSVWDSLLQLFPQDWRPATVDASGDNGWQLDPDGDGASASPGTDNGWQIDPNG